MLDINATFLVTFAVLWILVVVLGKIFFKPFQKLRRERTARIEGDFSASRLSLDQNAEVLREIDRTLKAARADAAKIRDDLEAEAAREKARLVQDVGATAKAEVEKAKAELAHELDGLKSGLADRAMGLSESIEEKVLQ